MLKTRYKGLEIIKDRRFWNVENRAFPNLKSVIGHLDTYGRTCSSCGKFMCQGFVIENGESYYCSDECLHKDISEKDYEELYDDGNGDSYWTEWDSVFYDDYDDED